MATIRPTTPPFVPTGLAVSVGIGSRLIGAMRMAYSTRTVNVRKQSPDAIQRQRDIAGMGGTTSLATGQMTGRRRRVKQVSRCAHGEA